MATGKVRLLHRAAEPLKHVLANVKCHTSLMFCLFLGTLAAAVHPLLSTWAVL